MLRLALKVDVDTLRGTLEGVPALVAALRAAGAGGTFLFSLGPDRTGRAIRRAFRPGFFSKVSRTSAARLRVATSSTCFTASTRKPSRSNVSSHQMASEVNWALASGTVWLMSGM